MLKPYFLFDSLKDEFNIKNDAALARDLSLAPPQISKVRNGLVPVNDSLILRIHEAFGVPVQVIRQALAKSASKEAEGA